MFLCIREDEPWEIAKKKGPSLVRCSQSDLSAEGLYYLYDATKQQNINKVCGIISIFIKVMIFLRSQTLIHKSTCSIHTD